MSSYHFLRSCMCVCIWPAIAHTYTIHGKQWDTLTRVICLRVCVGLPCAFSCLSVLSICICMCYYCIQRVCLCVYKLKRNSWCCFCSWLNFNRIDLLPVRRLSFSPYFSLTFSHTTIFRLLAAVHRYTERPKQEEPKRNIFFPFAVSYCECMFFFFFFILLLLLGTHTHTLTLRGERFFIFFFRSVRSINFFCEDLGSYISVSGVVVCIQYFDVASYRNALRIVFQIMSRQFSKSFDIDVTYMYTKNFTLKSV